MYKITLSLFVVIVFTASCKKEKPIEAINTNNSRDSLTYQPYVPGSEWKYSRLATGFFERTVTTTRLNRDTILNSKTYQVYSNTGDILSNYYEIFNRQDGSKYFQIVPNSTNATEVMVLDTTKAVNETWIGGVNGNDQYSYTIVQKFPTYVLDNFTFRNVYKVYAERRKLSTQVLTDSGNTFYAQGIGLIYSDATIQGITGSLKLISLNLK
jgi:hypothetical protein